MTGICIKKGEKLEHTAQDNVRDRDTGKTPRDEEGRNW